MKNNEILKIYGKQYKEMTKRLLKEADLCRDIKRKCPEKAVVGIKPNLVSASTADYGATTHPEVVAAIIEYLQENGDFDIRILEGSWVGDSTQKCFRLCGYNELSKKYNVPLIDTQKDPAVKKDCHGMELSIWKSYFDIDYLINVPVLKGHCQTHVTCALKNMKGLIPNSEKRRFHTMGLHKPIAHLNTAIKQDFIVVDHICGDLDFEDGGNPVVRNCIMAAKDPVLTDAYVCRLLGYDIAKVSYVLLAQNLGIGSGDLKRARVLVYDRDASTPDALENGAFIPLPNDAICDEKVPDTRKILELSDVVNEVESCSACYGYLIPALDRLRDEGLLDELKKVLPGRICIGQGYRNKEGDIGVGHCTSNFKYNIGGCPPTENAIYEGLKKLIT